MNKPLSSLESFAAGLDAIVAADAARCVERNPEAFNNLPPAGGANYPRVSHVCPCGVTTTRIATSAPCTCDGCGAMWSADYK